MTARKDWASTSGPAIFERMQQTSCTGMLGCHLLDAVGHWIQQAHPEPVTELLLRVLQR